MRQAAALLAWAPGLGFGLPYIYAIWHFANRGQIWRFLGYPTYGGLAMGALVAAMTGLALVWMASPGRAQPRALASGSQSRLKR
jgi:hypothetical protein